MLTVSAPALAAPSDDDTILPAGQKTRDIQPAEQKTRDETSKNSNDLQTFLDSLSQTFNDSIGRQLDAARDTIVLPSIGLPPPPSIGLPFIGLPPLF